MTDLAAKLLGTWRLESWSLVYADGRPPEFPLGEDAVGYLMYTTDGHVSAALARARRTALDTSDATSKARAFDEFFAYAGRFEVREGAVVHKIELGTNPALAGVNSVRHVKLDGDRLTLTGSDFSAGSPRSHRILWRRA
jgi:Lipocalin-like domain